MIVDRTVTLTESLPIASTMQAAILYGKEDVRLESVPVPPLPREKYWCAFELP